ncbi:hypothetical protein H072_7781 [Dactylellina haptotyla CBS 200.50]|uniref:Peptidase S33 tripeptidyl aminopeptidase-like C-terminal domain-containing protein n=1 Tax=Dactylellina haptotyla (strain CBS 200.50) TaxID=1284197 RepID=S8A638_DACHA|nr:hypothetical protein H072_7781 [Dactylellina haptotyla CBS 200.50]
MKGFIAAAAAVLPSIASAAPQACKQYFFDTIPASLDLVWYPCNQTFECARLSVPLNPLEPNNGLRSEIPIIKYPANKSDEYKGIILTNPGGPGGLGISYILNTGAAIANFTGPGWDIIGFDPRGMGYSVPNGATGFTNLTAPAARNATYIPRSQLTKRAIRSDHYGLEIPPRPDSWIDTIYQMGADFNVLLQANANGDNQAVPYMTTPNVAFDMLQIAKADARSRGLCEDTVLVNYYGVSYGTVVGQTFTSLYPQHVGRFVIDSVVDLKDWYEGNPIRSAMNHSDEGIAQFFTRCFDAGPEKCSFFTGRTSHAIRDRFNNLMAQFDAPKAIEQNWANATVVQYAQEVIKNVIIIVPYNALNSFPPLADTLTTIEALVQSNNVTIESMTEIFYQWSPPADAAAPERPENVFETWCSDSIANTEYVGSHKPLPRDLIDTVREFSVATGERFIQVYGVCSQLDLRPKWRFNGTYGATTKTPVLFIGVSKDPITPIENAELARKRHPGSKMIYVDAVGHGIVGQRNWCVYDKVRAYYQDLVLPGHDNRCGYGDIPFEWMPSSAAEKRSLDGNYRHSIARLPYFPL